MSAKAVGARLVKVSRLPDRPPIAALYRTPANLEFLDLYQSAWHRLGLGCRHE
jgi:hypothetical protein